MRCHFIWNSLVYLTAYQPLCDYYSVVINDYRSLWNFQFSFFFIDTNIRLVKILNRYIIDNNNKKKHIIENRMVRVNRPLFFRSVCSFAVASKKTKKCVDERKKRYVKKWYLCGQRKEKKMSYEQQWKEGAIERRK